MESRLKHAESDICLLYVLTDLEDLEISVSSCKRQFVSVFWQVYIEAFSAGGANYTQ